MKRQSCLYEGTVRHRRRTPVENHFEYRTFMLYLDLEELPGIFDGFWLWSLERPNVAAFRRRDYLGPVDLPLDESVRRRVRSATGRRPAGPIRLLTHLAYFGYNFNPVSFYYCFDERAGRVETIVAEITNTPWKERHVYVLDRSTDEGRGRMKRHRFPKVFYVSPFNSMELDYDWRFSEPGKSLNVHMIVSERGSSFFDATLRLRRSEISSRSLARALVFNPPMTAKVTALINWQALRLRLKGAPSHPHMEGGHG